MKRILLLFFAVGSLAALSSCNNENYISSENIATSFSSRPPQSSYPWVWWHWMEGNITKEGIRKDLLWMHDVGVGGLHQFDAGGRHTPQIVEERLPYLSDKWKDAFRYALELTDSLGIEVAVASCPGWSSTGGPWVKRENAMKKLVWRSLETEGGDLTIQLPEPFTTVGKFQDVPYGDAKDIEPWYEDIATVAVKLPDKDRSLEELGASVRSSSGDFTLGMLTDGKLSTFDKVTIDPKTGCGWIEYSFPAPITFKAVTVAGEALRGRYIPVPAEVHIILECCEGGGSFTKVADIPDNVCYSMTVDFPETTAKVWRLRILPGDGAAASHHMIREFVLHSVSKVNHSEEKAAFAAQHDFMSFSTPESEDAIKDIVVLDLPGKDGEVKAFLPEGRWRIYRFGQSLTGKKNHPAPPEATGLEVDKLDPDAWMDHFHSYIEMYKEASGGLVGQHGIQYILTDSYEAEQMTWTARMAEQFKTRKSYDLIRWLPALTGEILESSGKTEQFLWDWRNVIGDLFAENYDRINDIVKEYGMRGRYTEAHELGRLFVGDGMDIKMTATVPMSAIWMDNTPTSHSHSQARMDIMESASAAHVFGQNIAAAESFTVSGIKGRAYTYCPENLKYTADVALSAGLNRFVFHDSAHQPLDDAQPGTGLFQYGQWFNRHETWASMARPWMDYLARSCYMLQQGRFVADILWFYGEDNCITGLYGMEGPEVPDGYSYDFINPKGLLGEVSVRKKNLVTKSGMSYKVLVLGKNCRRMSIPVLRCIVRLAADGIQVCGTLPEEPAGMNDSQEEFSRLRGKLSALMNRGSVKDALEASGTAPDFTSSVDSVSFVHRTLKDMDIYWVRNFSKKSEAAKAEITLRTPGGKFLEIWNPEDGSRILSPDFKVTSKGIKTSVDMDRNTALFLVVKKASASDPSVLPAPLPSSKPSRPVRINGPWTVSFNDGRGAPGQVVWKELADWSASPDAGIRYYSGTATYSSDLIVEGPVEEAVLDLGSVKNLAEVSVNGTVCGMAWKAPFKVSIPSGVLKSGKNNLSIRVANLWVNRIIGDLQPDCPQTFTVTPQKFYDADSPLLSSGLLGPVNLEY